MLAGKKSALSKKLFLGTKNKDINHPLGSSRQQGLILKRLGPTKSRQQDTLFWLESSPQPTPLLPLSNVQYMPIIQEGSSVGSVAYVASVSNWVSAQKLEQEQKKQKGRGKGRGKEETLFPSLPSPYPVIPFLCCRLNFLAKLARKRLLRRLFVAGWGVLDTLTSSKRYGKWLNSRKIMLLGTLSLLYSHWLFFFYRR